VSGVSTARPLRIAALVKQIPTFEDMTLGPDGRLRREGLRLHMNDYCRRAVAQGVALADATGGTCTAITLGPPAAHTVLREAMLCGTVRGVHVSDPALAGSDTLATARALAAAIAAVGPFDLVLCGRNSIDADTGQVPPQLAELLDLPLLTGARELTLGDDGLRALLEHDDEWVEATVRLPAVVSCAERLIDPCKIKDPAAWAEVDAGLITTLTAADLGPGPWGEAASPTWVGTTRAIAVDRLGLVLDGEPAEQARTAAAVLADRAVLAAGTPPTLDAVPTGGGDGPVVAVLVEPDRSRPTRELLGAAAVLAADRGGRVVAIGPAPGDPTVLAAQGADEVVVLDAADGADAPVESEVAHAAADWLGTRAPWAVLAPSTAWGREIAGRIAARLGAGLTGDAVELTVEDGRLVAWKPAFGGALVAAIGCRSEVQMATVRAGVLGVRTPRTGREPTVEHLPVSPDGRVRVLGRRRDDDSDELATAAVVLGVGQGVDPADYPLLHALADRLGAALCATRKVTDKGWMPRARQVGITGHTIAPRLYVAVGTSGKFNHTAGVRTAGTIVAVNLDPGAEIHRWADVGLVGDWRELLPALVDALVPEGQTSNR
jgi:electron transfer flavoprotein alpha subunit